MDRSRQIAFKALLRFEKYQGKPDSIIERLTCNVGIDGRDKAFITEIVYGVLRWRRALDLIAGSQSRRPISKIDAPVLTLLRMGLYQAFGMSKTPRSAAVNETVELAKADNSTKHTSGFINAVIRGAIRAAGVNENEPMHISQVALSFIDDDRARLGAQYSFPDWLVKRWINNFGEQTAERIMDASNQRAPVFLRVNRLKIDNSGFEMALAKSGLEAERVEWADDLYMLTEGSLSPDSELITDGLCRGQDGASYISADLLSPAPHETVADICCGKGIKTALFAERMGNSGSIFCGDSNCNALVELNRNLRSLDAKIQLPVQMDASDTWPVNRLFNKIFVDAPCSGTGILRRRPEGKWTKSESLVKRMAEIQSKILDQAVDHLADGGELIYAVCSIEPEEGQLQIERLLKKLPGLARVDITKERPEYAQFINDQSEFYNLPGSGNMDGFYAAKLSSRRW